MTKSSTSNFCHILKFKSEVNVTKTFFCPLVRFDLILNQKKVFDQTIFNKIKNHIFTKQSFLEKEKYHYILYLR